MTRRLLSASAALLLMATSAQAQTYFCTFKRSKNLGTISPEVTVVFDKKGGAIVTDALSLTKDRAPVTAKFAEDTDKQMRVRWRLEDVVSSRGQKATLEWSLVYKKKRNRAHMTFNAFGYPNTETGSGTCALTK